MTRHLGMQVSAYVDRRLDAPTLHEFDRHLIACQICQHAADQERRLLSSLRTGATPGLSEGLQSMLLGLGTSPFAGTAPRPASSPPILPVAVRQPRIPLPTVAPAAPALHRSPRRAAVLAGLAAGASAAAAIGLAVASPVAVGPSPSRPPVARVPGTPTVGAETAVLLVSRVGGPAPRAENVESRGR